jgi:hypothetical protein
MCGRLRRGFTNVLRAKAGQQPRRGAPPAVNSHEEAHDQALSPGWQRLLGSVAASGTDRRLK